MKPRTFLIPVAFTLIAACRPQTATAPSTSPPAAEDDALSGAKVVPNTEARTGDVTKCPYSGRNFVVAADSPRFDYNGKTYVLCSEKARDAVASDPARYLEP